MLEHLLESETFPYALAVLQSRVKKIPTRAFRVTNQESGLISRLREILESELDTCIYVAKVPYRAQALVTIKYRLVYYNTQLMNIIREQTNDNASIPNFVDSSRERRRNYIRGFFDSSASVSHTTHVVRRFDNFAVEYPRVTIHKDNPDLLRALASLLKRENIRPTLREADLRIHRLSAIKKIIRAQLFTDPYKAQRLQDTYRKLSEYQEATEDGDNNAIVLDLIDSGKTVSKQVQEFISRSGRARRTYFEIKRRLKAESQLL